MMSRNEQQANLQKSVQSLVDATDTMRGSVTCFQLDIAELDHGVERLKASAQRYARTANSLNVSKLRRRTRQLIQTMEDYLAVYGT